MIPLEEVLKEAKRREAKRLEEAKSKVKIEIFGSGATRSDSADKVDFEGCLSPLVLLRFGQYMLKHQTQADGKPRAPDNWQKGMDKARYIKGLFRHFVDVWLHRRGYHKLARHDVEDALCGVIFNVQGYLFEMLKEKYEKENEAKDSTNQAASR